MKRRTPLIASFFASFAAVSVERGLYFFTEHRFQYGRAANLSLGLLLGLSCIVGALSSHAAATRWGERRVALMSLAGQALILLALTVWPRQATVWLAIAPFGLLASAAWPIITSYITAGLASQRILREVGWYCIAWSLAVPPALALSGPLIESKQPSSLFAVAAVCLAMACLVLLRLPPRPAHLAPDDPNRPESQRLHRYRQLMLSSRWLMLGAYGLLLLLTPLMPHILITKLELSTSAATSIASLVDWTRLAAFIALGWVTAWYGRAEPLLAAVLLLPAGFFAVLLGPTVAWVVVGQCVFGGVSGLVYYVALFYALAARNAAVEAGGGHEALIGLAFVLGPLSGLAGLAMSDLLGDEARGMLAVVLPLILLCAIGGVRPLLRLHAPPA